MPPSLLKLLPQSLVGRVFALYLGSLLLFVGAGLGIFYNYQFDSLIADAHTHGEMLIDVAAQTVSDSAVIGDHDTIERTLEKAAASGSHFAEASYIDVGGGIIKAVNAVRPERPAPAWLRGIVADRLYPINRVIAVGGRDYGVMRLSVDIDLIAAELWRLAVLALALAATSLIGGLVLIRIPLLRWLANFDRIRLYEQELHSGQIDSQRLLAADTPLEVRETFALLDRIGASLQAQKIEAAVTLNAIADGVITTGADDRVIYCNPAAERMFGFTAAEVFGKPIGTALPAVFEPGDSLGQWRSRRIEVGDDQRGRAILDTTLSPISGSGGELVGHVLACRDVTESHALDQRLRQELQVRKRALVALRGILGGSAASDGDAEDDLELLSDRVAALMHARETDRRALDNQKFALDQHAIVSITDLAGTIIYANDRFCAVSGFSRAELIGQSHRLLKSGAHPPEFYRDLWLTIVAGRVWHGEIKNRKKDGGFYWVNATVVPLLGADGRPEQYVAIRTDITARKAVEEQFAEQLHLTEILLEAIPTAIYIKDTDGRYVRFNRAFEELFGIDRNDWIGHTVFELVPSEAAAAMYAKDRELFREGMLQSYEARFINRRNGEVRDGLYRKALLTRADGSVSGIVGAVTDITERRRFERELEEAKFVAEAANRAKSDFLANMSHEIRTPMNGIIGMTDLTLDTDLDAAQREYLGIVRSSAEALMVILNDILDFSKIEAGKLNIESIPFSLPVTVTETLKSISARADAKGLELLCDMPADLPEAVEGDPGRIRQVLTNLCDNAIKFTTRGEIVVRVSCSETGDGQLTVEIGVADTGVGIAPDKQQAIFEAFTQADTSTTRQYGGTGLGLTICARLVDLMGGRIWVDSVPGQGSHFHFTVNLRRGAPVVGELPQLRTWPGARALVVEDHAISRQGISHWLQTWGFTVDVAADGEAGLACCRASDYALILLDARMPRRDGFGMVEDLREAALAATSRLVMLTSGGTRGDAQRCRELGIAAYLTKPVTPLELRETLSRVFDTASATPPALLTRHVLRDRQRSLNILLVEDHEVNRRLATTLFEKWGHRVVNAGNGQEALELFASAEYDIIFMDIQMPVMGGIEATGEIRRRERAAGRRRIPIVAMTANAMQGDRDACIAAGMDDYIAKPFKGEVVRRVIESRCARQGIEPPSPRAATAVAAAAAGRASALEFELSDAEIEAALDSAEADVIDIAGDVFAEQFPRDLVAVRSAFTAGDFDVTRRIGHNLKSTLALFGLRQLAATAAEIERQPGDCAAALGRLEAVGPRLVAAVARRIA